MNRKINDITLELSLRPFIDTTETGIRTRAQEIFIQWLPLVRHADRVSVMMWTSDGSEILEYTGDIDASFEWSHTIGCANPRWDKLPPDDPRGLGIHRNPSDYIENPPIHTYRWYKRFLEIVRNVGEEVTAKPVQLGATFDPGPEFAKSKFKYEKHVEICLGDTAGDASFVVCYAELNADKNAYAGYPKGIPQGTNFGEFLGRQSKHFLDDMGFDFLWLSNGFGFGKETWGMYGAVFNGKEFSPAKAVDVKKISLDFWNNFRKGCPKKLLRTRGTNLLTGRDLACDGVPLREIYRGGFNMEPPVNSPWAAINGDFGLELAGWMSHIAEIPNDTYPFRYYVHDNWFLNSPWLDRYGREPHDIYLPLAISRIDRKGCMSLPSHINILSVDNTYGQTPDQVPNEVIPCILDCLGTSPDAPGLCTWLYPFDEYHDMAYDAARIGEVFFGDWFIRTAINNGFPLNTVVSTKNYLSTIASNPKRFAQTILVTPVPSTPAIAQALLEHLSNGGRILLYGPTAHADASILSALNCAHASGLEGELDVMIAASADTVIMHARPSKILHTALSSAGSLTEILAQKDDASTRIVATAKKHGEERIIALSRKGVWNGGTLAWVRGTNSFRLPDSTRARTPEMLDAKEYFYTELLLRQVLKEFNFDIAVHKREGSVPNPMLSISRHKNAFYFAGHSPNVTVSQSLRFSAGAPVFNGFETFIEHGCAAYHMPKAWRRECRVFVDQKEASIVSCAEQPAGQLNVNRRLLVRGTKNAVVRFFPEPGTENGVVFLLSPEHPFIKGDFAASRREETCDGVCLTVDGISDDLLISW
jgi:hypothetical protein